MHGARVTSAENVSQLVVTSGDTTLGQAVCLCLSYRASGRSSGTGGRQFLSPKNSFQKEPASAQICRGLHFLYN